LSRSHEQEIEEEILYSSRGEVVEGTLLAYSAPIHSLIEELRIFNSTSPEIQSLIHRIEKENLRAQGYEFREGLMFFKGRFYILPNSKFVDKLLQEFHDGYIGGHSGIDRTYNRLSTHFWSKGMLKDCLLYTSDAADDLTRVDLGGCGTSNKKNNTNKYRRRLQHTTKAK